MHARISPIARPCESGKTQPEAALGWLGKLRRRAIVSAIVKWRSIIATAVLLGGGVVPRLMADAAECDAIVPEEFSSAEPLELSPSSERAAQAMALYVQAIFQEESDGPDAALPTKRKVLELDPGFSQLAVDTAFQYLRHGESADAIAVLKDAAKANPREIAPAVALSGIYLRQLSKPDLAERYAQQALQAAPDRPEPYEALWDVYRAASQRHRIEQLFQRAAKRPTKDPTFWIAVAELRLRDRGVDARNKPVETQAALEFLEKVAAAPDVEPETLVRAADFFVLCARVDRAAELYQQALEQKPGLEGVLERLAACLLEIGDLPRSADVLGRIIKANPLEVRAYDQLATVQLKSGEPAKALASLRQALLIAPADPRRYQDAIRLALGSGDPGAALELGTEASTRFPKTPEFTLLRAIALSELDRHDEAIKAFEQTLVEAGNARPELLDAEFHFSYGVACEQAGRYVKAAELLEKSIELDPENSAKACNYLGYMWADRNENLDRAEELIRRALAKEPDSGAYVDSLGWVLYRKGRYEEALAELLRASQLIPAPDPVVLDHIGDAYEKLGRTAEAVIYWQKAFALDNNNKAIVDKIDRLASRLAQQPKAPATPQTPAR